MENLLELAWEITKQVIIVTLGCLAAMVTERFVSTKIEEHKAKKASQTLQDQLAA